MGGIVAVDSFLAMTSDKDPIARSIAGVLAYDTPFLGLNPPVYHRTISTRVEAVSSALSSAKQLIPQSWLTQPSTQAAAPAAAPQKSKWSFGKLAGVAAGVAAVGALSYLAKDTIVNHLQFVSVLYKPDALAARMKQFTLTKVGFAVFYTVIRDETGEERTFCLLPKTDAGGTWIRQENGLAKDEVEAHCGMFVKTCNDHYEDMCTQSLGMIRKWIGEAGQIA